MIKGINKDIETERIQVRVPEEIFNLFNRLCENNNIDTDIMVNILIVQEICCRESNSAGIITAYIRNICPKYLDIHYNTVSCDFQGEKKFLNLNIDKNFISYLKSYCTNNNLSMNRLFTFILALDTVWEINYRRYRSNEDNCFRQWLCDSLLDGGMLRVKKYDFVEENKKYNSVNSY